MAELRNQNTATPATGELDDVKLLGFEWLEPERDQETQAEEALGIAFNKRGEVVPKDAPPR
jgi:hypothetical protein